jgi:hypothetical protein
MRPYIKAVFHCGCFACAGGAGFENLLTRALMGVKNNERFARAGKADVNGKRPLEGLALDHDELCPSQ